MSANPTSSGAVRSRTPERPYCWQSKTARRVIREAMNGHESTASVLSLYDALTEIASDYQSETFTAGQPYIGEKAGMSAKNVSRHERSLEEFGLIRIDRPKMRGHHTYTILSLNGHSVPAYGQDVPTLGHRRFRPSCPPVEVTSEGTSEGTSEEHTHTHQIWRDRNWTKPYNSITNSQKGKTDFVWWTPSPRR